MFGKKSPDSESDDEDGNHDYETLSEHYMTIGEFQAQASDGLSFQEGIEVSVITKNPSGWWFVEAGSDEGWVPSSYLEKSFKPHSGKSNVVSPQLAKPKPFPPKRVEPPTSNSSFNPKPKPPARRDTVTKSPVTIPPIQIKPATDTKSKPPPPTRRDIRSQVNGDNDTTDSGRQSISPPVPTKPRPSVSKRPIVAPRKSTDGGTSVSAMAAVLSQGFNKPGERRSSVDDNRRPSVSKKPIVPRRDPVPENRGKSDSLRRSASSESLREIDRQVDERMAKTPHMVRSLNTQVSDSKPMKFLRKSQENLLAATQAEEERQQQSSASPIPAPRKSISTIKVGGSPKFMPTKSTSASSVAQSKSTPKPPPPSRNHIPPSNSQTLKLAGIEKALKSGKSPPVMPAKRPINNTLSAGGTKKVSPPQRPKDSPAQKQKKTPPPRPGNSPAAGRKISYVTIADYGGYDDASISFSEGESIKVLEKNPDGWWYVEIGGREGWVPSTFIDKSDKPDRPAPPPVRSKPRPPPPVKKDKMCRAVADYVTEDSEINLMENEEYEVLEKADNGWWFVKKGGDEGWAPSSFLESL